MIRTPTLWLTALLLSATILSSKAAAPATAAPPSGTEVYFTPFSHLDFFWGGTREECLARGNRIIAKVIRLANESPKFHFLLEDNVFVSNYVETHPGSHEVEDLKRLVKAGRIEIAPKWVGIFQGLPDGEVHARNMTIGKRYAKSVFGVDPLVAHLGDLPDYTPQFPQILSQSRVPFMVMTRMGPSDKSLFRWRGLDGSKALVWNTLKGYGWGTFLTSKTQLDDQKRERFRKDLADVRATTDGPILMNWGTDLWAPPDDLVTRVEAFNQSALAKLVISTPGQFFSRVEKAPGIAELAGEIPSSWPNIVSSLPHLWPEIIPATNTLLAAEKFATINYALGYADYPQQDFEFMWKKLVESMDHNHDGQGGAIGDGRKAEYERLSVIRGGEILRDSLRNIAERVQVPIANSFPIVVFNPLGWTRDDIVKSHLTLYGDISPADIGDFKKGLRLLDEAGNQIPFYVEEYSENISRALQIVFEAKHVPSLGYKTFYLVAADSPAPLSRIARVELDQDKDRRDPRRPAGSDVIENSFYRLTIDRPTGRVTLFDKALNRDVVRDMEVSGLEERGGNYIGIEPPTGRTIVGVVDDIRLEENNDVRTVVRVSTQVAGIPIVQRLTLYHGLKRLDIENAVEWKTPRYIRLQQLFPLTQPNATLNYGVPFGANSSDNMMPNTSPHARDEITEESWRRSRHIHDWIHAGTAQWGLTIAADHQQVRLGNDVIAGEMLRGTKFTSAKVVRGDAVMSMNYPPPGTYVFRYSLSSSSGDWRAAKAYRAGKGLTNPLIPISVVDEISKKTLPPTNSFCALKQDNLVISSLKKSDLDSSLLLRVYEIEGAPVKTPVEFLGEDRSFGETNLIEEDVAQQPRQTLETGPYAIRTLKLNIKKPGR